MYDEIYTYPDNKKNEDKTEKMKFGFKDIFAMTIAAYQILAVPMGIMILVFIILYLLMKLVVGS